MTARARDAHRALVAVLGPTSSGKSALGMALAERFDGEIVSCDSTAVYRGFDIGTDKVAVEERRGIPHHLIDTVDPATEYTAADYARDAIEVITAIRRRGRLPIVVGGTGFYYRALSRGLFPGPGKDAALRRRLDTLALRAGTERLHRLLARIDAPSARRIHPHDRVRVVRALEVYFQTGRTLTEHFSDTEAPLAGWSTAALALGPPWAEITDRIARRVDRQFDRGIVGEVRSLLDAGVPEASRPFAGYVYRHVLEVIQGRCDEASARESIIRENRRYARRQLIWFRKEPNLDWIALTGERREALAAAVTIVSARLAWPARRAEQEEGATHGCG
ncbi:MAG: tRNA (adenosine(37)-N6)-dimethylallyltransferase MiaA [Acidobacteriota bacterium]